MPCSASLVSSSKLPRTSSAHSGSQCPLLLLAQASSMIRPHLIHKSLNQWVHVIVDCVFCLSTELALRDTDKPHRSKHIRAAEYKSYNILFPSLWRQPEAESSLDFGGSNCKLKAAFFLLALLRCLGRQGKDSRASNAAVISAFQCLTAPFAWQESLLAATSKFDCSKAEASDIMTSVASLKLAPLALPADFSRDSKKASSSVHLDFAMISDKDDFACHEDSQLQPRLGQCHVSDNGMTKQKKDRNICSCLKDQDSDSMACSSPT